MSTPLEHAAPHPGLFEALFGGSRHGSLLAWERNGYTRTSWAEVARDARGMATTLRGAGVRPGARVAAVLDNSPAAVRGLAAIWMAGGVAASLPLPARGVSTAEYGRQLTVLVQQLDPEVLLLGEALAERVPPEIRAALPVLPWSALAGDGHLDPSPPGPDETAFVQYSSGSTSVPKGCALTPRAIATHLGMMLEMAHSTPGQETIACWLPLSHDMGVFGCLVNSWAYDFDLVLSTPERFAMAPRTWFRDMAEHQATMTAGTSTALRLATRAHGRTSLSRPLNLRVFVLGAERVHWSAVREATERFAASGLAPEAFMPAYGMAEATLALTATPWDTLPSARTFDGAALLDGRCVEVAADADRAVPLVSNGPPLRGVTVTAGAPGTTGEIVIDSPSLASGYYRDPGRTSERFVDGRLRTGDIGFLHDGELYVVGRADDLISVGGRKVYTSEVECALDELDTLRKGCSVLVDVVVDDRSRLVLLTEPRRRQLDFQAVADEAADVARRTSGVAVSECWFLERGVMPRTPSGKIQRFRCRALVSGERLATIARVSLG